MAALLVSLFSSWNAQKCLAGAQQPTQVLAEPGDPFHFRIRWVVGDPHRVETFPNWLKLIHGPARCADRTLRTGSIV